MIVDDSILEGCIEGKRDAQYQLYRKFASSMLAVCFRYAKNRDEAEDFLQEGFLKVFQNIRSFRKEGSFEGWIKRIMINHALNEIKKSHRLPFHEDIGAIRETDIIDPHEGAVTGDPVPVEVLHEMIRSLPEGYRVVFSLYVLEEFSHREIADALNISENTSKTQLLKAKRTLRIKVNEYFGKKTGSI